MCPRTYRCADAYLITGEFVEGAYRNLSMLPGVQKQQTGEQGKREARVDEVFLPIEHSDQL